MRRIGVLMNLAADDPEAPARVAALAQGLGELGWAAGRNVMIDYRWGAGDTERIRKHAAELVAVAPQVILVNSSQVVAALLQATRTVPIVFVGLPDPVGAGFVNSLARPGGNITGFLAFEFGMSAKRLELLKEVAPQTTRVAMIRDPTVAANTGMVGAIQAVAPSLGVELSLIDVRDASEIEHAVTAFARSPNGGLIVTGGALATLHRDVIIKVAARHRLPAVYSFRYYVTSGGLISYGPDAIRSEERRVGKA